MKIKFVKMKLINHTCFILDIFVESKAIKIVSLISFLKQTKCYSKYYTSLLQYRYIYSMNSFWHNMPCLFPFLKKWKVTQLTTLANLGTYIFRAWKVLWFCLPVLFSPLDVTRLTTLTNLGTDTITVWKVLWHHLLLSFSQFDEKLLEFPHPLTLVSI